EHRRAVAEACRGDRDVRRRPPDRLAERADVAHRHAELLGVQVDRDPADRQQVERTTVVGHTLSSDRRYWRLRATPCAGPSPAAGSPGSITSVSITYQPS